MIHAGSQNSSIAVKVDTWSIKESGRNLRTALETFEKQLILEVLTDNLGHRGKTAEVLGIDRKTLYTKLKKYGIVIS